jgi:hypothetical protein
MSAIFVRPTNTLTSLKSAALSAYGVTPLVGSNFDLDAYLLVAQALTQTAVSGVTGGDGPPGTGLAACFSDNASGAYLLQHFGSLIHLSSGAVITPYAAEASGSVFTGGVISSGNLPYIVDSAGNLFTLQAGVLVGVGTAPAFGDPPALTLSYDGGANLYTNLASASGIGSFHLTGATAGASGLIASPFQKILCIAASGTNIAAGGYNYASITSGYSALAFNPNLPNFVAGVPFGGSGIDVITIDAYGNWAVSHTTSGVGVPASLAWSANGETVLAATPGSNALYVLEFTFGALALSQTLTVSGAAAIGLFNDSATALVCSPSQNEVTPLSFNGVTWAAGTPLAIADPTSIATLLGFSAAVGMASGVIFYELTGSTWAPYASGALPFTPTGVASDLQGNAYACGSVSASGELYLVSPTMVSGAPPWPGNAVSAIGVQGQAIVYDATNSLLRIFGSLLGVPSQSSTITAPASGLTLALAASGFAAAGHATVQAYDMVGPGVAEQVRQGVVGVYNTGTTDWSTLVLGDGHVPTALAWNPSGNVSVATLQNSIYSITPTATLSVSGTVPQFAGQPQTTPIGLSDLLWLEGVLYSATSLNDSLVTQISSGA